MASVQALAGEIIEAVKACKKPGQDNTSVIVYAAAPPANRSRGLFGGKRPVVEVEDDPEIADESCLAIIVRNSVDDAHELFQISSGWHRRLYDCCPAHLAAAFRLNTDWQP